MNVDIDDDSDKDDDDDDDVDNDDDHHHPLCDGVGPRPTRGTRRGATPRATKFPSGVGERCRFAPNGKMPVATPFPTEVDGSSNPKSLSNHNQCEGTPGARTTAQYWSGIVRCLGAPRTVVQDVEPRRGATPRMGPIGRSRIKDDDDDDDADDDKDDDKDVDGEERGGSR